MELQNVVAEFHDEQGDTYMESLRLKSLFVCASATNNQTNLQRTLLKIFESEAGFLTSAHLVYAQDDFIDELRRCGYSVSEHLLTLPIEDKHFNELDFSHADIGRCEIFMFKDLAVKTGMNGLEVFEQPDMTVMDVAEHWNLQDTLAESDFSKKCSVPNNELGTLAIEVERLQYACWESFEQAPGESMDVDERLDLLTILCESLNKGDDLSDVIADCLELLQYTIDDSLKSLQNGDASHREYHQKQIDTAKKFLVTANELGRKCESFAAAHSQLPDTGMKEITM